MKSFVCLGRNVGNQPIHGAVVASSEHIYMIIEIDLRGVTPSGRIPGGGLIGGAIGMAVQAARKWDQFTTGDAAIIKYSEPLPTAITSHPDWPVAPKKDYEVVIFPKSMISSIKKKWPNRFLITVVGREYKVDYTPFTGQRKNILRDLGWILS